MISDKVCCEKHCYCYKLLLLLQIQYKLLDNKTVFIHDYFHKCFNTKLKTWGAKKYL